MIQLTFFDYNFNHNYTQCERCGAWHDDGMDKLCLDCLDKIALSEILNERSEENAEDEEDDYLLIGGVFIPI